MQQCGMDKKDAPKAGDGRNQAIFSIKAHHPEYKKDAPKAGDGRKSTMVCWDIFFANKKDAPKAGDGSFLCYFNFHILYLLIKKMPLKQGTEVLIMF